MKNFTRGFLLCSLFLVPSGAVAGEGSERAAERKAERLEGDLGVLRRDQTTKLKELSAAKGELGKAKLALSEAERRQAEFLLGVPADRARSPAEEDRLSAMKSEAAKASARVQAAVAEIALIKEDQASLKNDAEAKEDALDRAEAAKLPRKVVSADCPDGSCAGGRKGPPNQTNRSDWENVADILKAVTPMGLGAMSTYLNYQGIKQQSADYRYYNANNTALGLPSAAPTSSANLWGSSGISQGSGFGYGSFSVGGFGSTGLGFGNGMGSGFGGSFGSYGMGYGAGFGAGYNTAFAGYNPYGNFYGNSYGNSYGSAYNPYATTGYAAGYSSPYTASYGSTYGTSYAAYGANTVAASVRTAQQQAIFSSDALVAQQSLLGSYSSYNQVMQSVGSTGTVPYGSYLNYNSNGGYGGITTLYNPAAATNTALNAVRQ